ncbi:TolC family outer membrane protein [Qipengyuania atrilutea]|uniref:TolC family outer membrane protein n=1 Tax=Qipengyuania atrilutea TaxID=2744473 RepID=A0A850HBM6_9SPHN|nr:TolC family outer membrane protein [Actirhodobacter atriluteus]NVD44479.1 TolC family outer membrane protein [Actirhodobacter atriluteus]
MSGQGRLRSAGYAVTALASCAVLALTETPAYADTLREALLQAYRSNPTLESARSELRAIDENVPIQKSAGRPSVEASGTYTEILKQNSTSFFSPSRAVNTGIDLGVPIYSGGAVKYSVRAAVERVEAGRADLRGTESAIFSQVVAAYMDVLRSEAVVGLTANQVEVLGINLQATSDRFEIGILTRTDVAQSQARLALAEGDLRSAQSNLISARETYIQLVGEAPTNLQPPPPLTDIPSDVETAVDIALENNPDLIAARERAVAAGYDIRVAGAQRLPRVSVFTGYDYQNFLGSVPDGVLDPDDPNSEVVASPQVATGAQAGVSFSIPLFQGGRIAAQQRQAQARASVALEQIVAAERDVIAQVRAAWASLQASQAIIASSQTAVDAAALSLEGVRAENSVGNRTIIDILDAEQELLNTQVQLVTARRNAYVAGFSLLAAMGRAEARDLGLGEAGPLYDPVVNYERVEGKFFDWDRDPDPETQSTRTIDVPAPDAEIPDMGPYEREPDQ